MQHWQHISMNPIPCNKAYHPETFVVQSEHDHKILKESLYKLHPQSILPSVHEPRPSYRPKKILRFDHPN